MDAEAGEAHGSSLVTDVVLDTRSSLGERTRPPPLSPSFSSAAKMEACEAPKNGKEGGTTSAKRSVYMASISVSTVFMVRLGVVVVLWVVVESACLKEATVLWLIVETVSAG